MKKAITFGDLFVLLAVAFGADENVSKDSEKTRVPTCHASGRMSPVGGGLAHFFGRGRCVEKLPERCSDLLVTICPGKNKLNSP